MDGVELLPWGNSTLESIALSVQVSLSVMSDSLRPHGWQHARLPCPSQPLRACSNSWSLLKLTSIKSVMPSNHLILCLPILLLPSIFPSISVFSSESVFRIRWPEYWSFSFSISLSNEYSGLISFRMHWLDVHGCPRDSQEPSLTPQFKRISSSVLSFLYSTTLTSMHDCWKNHSFD